MTLFRTIGTVCALVALTGCATDPAPPQAESVPGEAQETEPALRGAVLILFDTLRADHLSCYGYSRATSPVIDSLAERGTRFDQALSNAPWTLPAVAGMLAGDYPERVFRGRLLRSLVQRLSSAGITTGAITEGGYVSRAFGLDLGFDDYREETGPVRIVSRGQAGSLGEGGIENTFALAREWLEAHREERFFLFVHTYEPHIPYTRHDFTEDLDAGQVGPIFGTDEIVPRLQSGETVLTGSETEYVTALYDGGVRTADRHLGELLAYLDESGLGARTATVVTSDHGEELGAHYPSRTGDHGHALLDTLLRVPLVIHDPTRERKVEVVPSQVRLIDVMPTIAELLGVKLFTPIEGRSLLPLLEGSDTAPRLALAAQTRFGPQRLAMRHLGYKYIATVGPGDEDRAMLRPPPERQLYDLGADPHERTNLVDQRPEVAGAFQRELERHHRGLSAPLRSDEAELDPALIERLKSLGYVH